MSVVAIVTIVMNMLHVRMHQVPLAASATQVGKATVDPVLISTNVNVWIASVIFVQSVKITMVDLHANVCLVSLVMAQIAKILMSVRPGKMFAILVCLPVSTFLGVILVDAISVTMTQTMVVKVGL